MYEQYKKLKLSIRDIDKISNSFLMFCLFYKENIVNSKDINCVLEFYLYFMILKYKYPEIYKLITKNEFVNYNNSPKDWRILEKDYFTTNYITQVLGSLQTDGGQRKDSDLNDKYGFVELNDKDLSMVENIERVIELFT